MTRPIPLFLAAFLMYGCAAPTMRTPVLSDELVEGEQFKQRQMVLQQQRDAFYRLARVGYEIRRAGVAFCGEETRMAAGFVFETVHSYDEKLRDVATDAGLTESPQVTGIHSGTPAERAGLMVGDVLLELEGYIFPKDEGQSSPWSGKAWKDAHADGELELVVSRNGESVPLNIRLDKICMHPVRLVSDTRVNAYTDGDTIFVTGGMMKFSDTDQELALVLAHELAHIVQGHVESSQQNAWGGLMIDILISAATRGAYGGTVASGVLGRAYSQEFEAEADYVGLYIMARSDYSIEGTANIWRRLALENPAGIDRNHASTHPSTPERFLALEKTIEEIKGKQERGDPVLPDRRD